MKVINTFRIVERYRYASELSQILMDFSNKGYELVSSVIDLDISGNRAMYLFFKKIIKDDEGEKPWVDAHPTAYDVDKVVDELEKASCSVRPVGWSSEKEIVELKTAIDIVKEGGIDER